MTAWGAGIGGEFGLSRAGGYRYSFGRRLPALDPGTVSCVANGRAALGLVVRFLRQMAEEGRDRALLPAYLCHSMIQPFQEQGLRVDFYPVAGDLSIDTRDIAERLDDSTLVVMLMHYLGFGQPAGLLSSIADDRPEVAILDDRTHMLGTDLLAGELGRAPFIRVYSPRKWGPFPDLGLVVWPHSLESAAMSGLIDRAHDLGFAFWRLVGLVLRSLYFAFPTEPLRRHSLAPFHRADVLLDRRVRICRASAISRFLWSHWEWAEVCQIRRTNFQYLLDNWTSTDIVPLYRELPAEVCPLGFPVRTPQRDDLRRHLIERRIFPPIHWVRPAEVPAQDFPQAAALAEEELTIPIDQRHTLRQMDHVLDALSDA